MHLGSLLTVFATLTLMSYSSPTLARDFVVGQSIDLSGTSNLGKDFSNGIRTYFDAINTRGGVRGRKIQFVQLNDAGQAAGAQINIERLLREHDVDVLIAPTSAETLFAAANMVRLRSTALTLLGAPTGTDVNSGGGEFQVVGLRASFRDEAKQLLDALQTFNDGAIVLVRGDGPDAIASHAAVRDEATVRRTKIAFEGTTAQWQATKASTQRIGAVIISGDAIGAAPALLHARRIAPQAILLGFSSIDHRTLIELAGASAKGMMITQVVPPPAKTIHTFQREHRSLMKQYRDEPPSQHTLEGYIVARILVAAYELVEGEPNPAKVSNALRTVSAMDFGPMRVNARVGGIGNRYVDVTAISTKGGLIE